jgi:hypothetical protein
MNECYSYWKDTRGKPGNIPKSSGVSEIGAHCIEEYVQLFIKDVSGR